MLEVDCNYRGEDWYWTEEQLAEWQADAAEDKAILEIKKIAAASENVIYVDFRKQ